MTKLSYLMLSGHQYPQILLAWHTEKPLINISARIPTAITVRDSISIKSLYARTCEDSVFEHRDRGLYQIKRCRALYRSISEESIAGSVRETGDFPQW